MKKIVLIRIISITLLLTWCDVVSNITNDRDESNFNTIGWHQDISIN